MLKLQKIQKIINIKKKIHIHLKVKIDKKMFSTFFVFFIFYKKVINIYYENEKYFLKIFLNKLL